MCLCRKLTFTWENFQICHLLKIYGRRRSETETEEDAWPHIIWMTAIDIYIRISVYRNAQYRNCKLHFVMIVVVDSVCCTRYDDDGDDDENPTNWLHCNWTLCCSRSTNWNVKPNLLNIQIQIESLLLFCVGFVSVCNWMLECSVEFYIYFQFNFSLLPHLPLLVKHMCMCVYVSIYLSLT